MSTYYRTQAGDLNDAYWTNYNNSITGTLTTLSFNSGDELDLSNYTNSADYDLTMGATLYDVGVIINTYATNTAKLTIVDDVGTSAGIQIQCNTEIDGGSITGTVNRLEIDLLSIRASGVSNVTVLDGSYADISVDIIYIDSANCYGIINNGNCGTITIGGVNDTPYSQAGTAVSNTSYIDTLTFINYPQDIQFGSALLNNSGNIDNVMVAGFTNTSSFYIGILVTNTGTIADLKFGTIEVQGQSWAGGLLYNTGTITLLETTLTDWVNLQTNVIYNGDMGVIVTWTGSIASQCQGNYEICYNSGTINTLDCNITANYYTSRTYPIFKNLGVIVNFTKNIDCSYATTSYPSAPVFLNEASIYNWVGYISSSTGYITDYGMSNSGVIREWVGNCNGNNTLLNNYGGGAIWYWQFTQPPQGVSNNGDILTMLSDYDVTNFKLNMVKKGQTVITNPYEAYFSAGLLAKLTGTAEIASLGPWAVGATFIGPYKIGTNSVGPYEVS